MSFEIGETVRQPRANKRYRASKTRAALVAAAEACLREQGYSGLSTRIVAAEAGVPLSQIHYHFGSKQGLMLALLEDLNARLVARQRAMFAADLPLSERWDRACDYLDDDMASGYVRVLQEVTGLGWADPEVNTVVRRLQRDWHDLLNDVAEEAERRFGGLGPFTPREIVALISQCFYGAESILLSGYGESYFPVRSALRKIEQLIRQLEAKQRVGD